MNKRWMSYALPAVLSISSVLSLAATACAATPAAFSDTRNHWSADAVKWAVGSGIVDGYEDGTFRPNQTVSEPEFLAMLLRAYPSSQLTSTSSGSPWYTPYYDYAKKMNWPLLGSPDRQSYNRGHVARLIAGTQQGTALSLNDSIRFLLDQGLSQGKSSATVQGYAAADPLSRAEAVQFIRNLKGSVSGLKAAQPTPGGTAPEASAAAVSVRGIAIGDSEASVLSKLGQPARKDASGYAGMQWYIYNGDYSRYVQVGISGGKVTGLYAPGGWTTNKGLTDGVSRTEIQNVYGQPLSYILKGNTRFMNNYGEGEYGTYEDAGAYVTFFYDVHQEGEVTGVLVIDRSTELALASFYPQGSDTLARAFERQSFDLANAARVRLGLQPFAWDEGAAGTARAHSADMAAKGYFDHTNPAGQSPFDRMEAAGLSYSSAAENIAAGQTSAIHAHHGWMNSAGHRKNLLSGITRLGVGVAFGGKMSVYYTQNFLTP
ncbi:copper amine oxidase domain-containing protein [Paenibacillus mucilaginosus 3016]|uniref:Copper amine oxidase domain-containing protein n=2 Tax=Paenibacillus mucilaginosus TaxID=61624 RepID=H6NIT1_9BACL|nr:CAP-associated domain-containing protein [Paenibacillus mucilaginosus]AFC33148.1 copper amine oxidase domain-containing protein [Paenibacillus mucilaginosus 3016]AFH65462.1 copper amine oxidase [Paenibacillus mucilaginosus K02]AFK65361.1 copper amine oxidase domain-containing protein [Paenibacillus mucilaginosus K02]WFA21579.1 copper amine oxidase [Paenibacillus mucilaginosus]